MIKILLVDDDIDDYILIKGMFVRLAAKNHPPQYTLDWAANSQEALSNCANVKYDVCLVDYYLGSENGLDLIQAMQANDYPAPFILLTGRDSYELDLAAMQTGVADYLLKDQITEQFLERTIRYTLERKATQEELEQRVAKRTQELAKKNQELLLEIERRIAAEQALKGINEELEGRVLLRTSDLQAANRQMETVLAALPVSLVIADQDGRIVQRNESFKKLWEPADELPNRVEDWEHFLAWWTETGVPLRRHDWPLVRAVHFGQATFNRLIDIESGSGSRKTVLYSAVPIFDPHGSITGGVAVSQDITEQRQLEMKAQASAQDAYRRADELEGLQKATAALLSTLEMDDLLIQILDAAQGAFPAAAKSLLHLTSGETGELKVRAWRGVSDDRIRRLRPADRETYLARVMREQKPLLVTELEDARDSFAGLDEAGSAKSLIIVPLVYGDKMYGTLSLISSQARAFDEFDMRLLVSFAATTTAILHNAMLHAEVKHLAARDPLTGKLNRRSFFELGHRELERFHRFEHPLSVMMIDLDFFKQINDQHGHSVGDQILRIVSDRINQVVREIDLFGRYGGDEFVLLMPGTDLENARVTAQRIKDEITGTPWMTSSGAISLTVSLGVAQAKKSHRKLEDLLADADQALYNAKHNGRNRIEMAADD